MSNARYVVTSLMAITLTACGGARSLSGWRLPYHRGGWSPRPSARAPIMLIPEGCRSLTRRGIDKRLAACC